MGLGQSVSPGFFPALVLSAAYIVHYVYTSVYVYVTMAGIALQRTSSDRHYYAVIQVSAMLLGVIVLLTLVVGMLCACCACYRRSPAWGAHPLVLRV
jgi:hypothetical protein